MTERTLTSAGYVKDVHWNLFTNTITLTTPPRKIRIKKDENDMDIEFLDENRKKCHLSLTSFNQLCDLRERIVSVTTLLKGETNPACNQDSNTESRIDSYAEGFLESILKIEYAKAIIVNIPAVQRINCPGCQANSTLEQLHQCLSITTEEKLKAWFNDILAVLDDAQVIEQYMKCTELLDCIETKTKEHFKARISDFQWLLMLKGSDKWRQTVKNAAIKLVQLEARFQITPA